LYTKLLTFKQQDLGGGGVWDYSKPANVIFKRSLRRGVKGSNSNNSVTTLCYHIYTCPPINLLLLPFQIIMSRGRYSTMNWEIMHLSLLVMIHLILPTDQFCFEPIQIMKEKIMWRMPRFWLLVQLQYI
jgi:hypothetical protein